MMMKSKFLSYIMTPNISSWFLLYKERWGDYSSMNNILFIAGMVVVFFCIWFYMQIITRQELVFPSLIIIFEASLNCWSEKVTNIFTIMCINLCFSSNSRLDSIFYDDPHLWKYLRLSTHCCLYFSFNECNNSGWWA